MEPYWETFISENNIDGPPQTMTELRDLLRLYTKALMVDLEHGEHGVMRGRITALENDIASLKAIVTRYSIEQAKLDEIEQGG